MKALLMATDHRFWETNNGSRQRIVSLVRFLASSNIQLHVFHTGCLSNEEISYVTSQFQGMTLHTPNRWSPIALNKLSTKWFRSTFWLIFTRIFLRPKPVKLHEKNILSRYRSEEVKKSFQNLCEAIKPGFILIEYLRLSYLIEDIKNNIWPTPKLLIDTHDVMFKRCESFKIFGQKHWVDITPEDECAALSLYDIVIAIQDKDASTFRIDLRQKHVITVGYVDHIYKPLPPKNREKIVLSYIASENEPNLHAILTFIENVWPKLKATHTSLELHVAGSICNLFTGIDLADDIVLFGFVSDIQGFYQNTDIVINPVGFGGGLKIKNVEALCNAKPLVTTTVGSEGMESGVNQAFISCDSSVEQFESIHKLIANPPLRQKLSEKAYLYASSNFIPEIAFKELFQVLDLQ